MMSFTIGYILDLIVGDPRWLPHPIRWIGQLIDSLEKVLYGESNNKVRGFLLLIVVSGIAFSVSASILYLAGMIHPYFRILLEAYMIFQIMATKSLYVEANKVKVALAENNLTSARKWISYLCSRDVSQMNEEDISKACIETVAENLCDGVIAPLFFIAIGGAPLGFFFKGVSTLDSMVGYKNEKFMDYGYASAKFDDVLNFIPARLTGILIVIVAFLLRFNGSNAFKMLVRDRRNHASPNSAYSEAAVAGALNIQLGGKATYFGRTSMKPTMGDPIEPVTHEKITDVFKILYSVSILFFLIVLGVKVWWLI